ncbi:ATPase AAA domain-containing protein [Balamuthia mandrillaris]
MLRKIFPDSTGSEASNNPSPAPQQQPPPSSTTSAGASSTTPAATPTPSFTPRKSERSKEALPYDRVRGAVENEKELMRMMVELGEEKFNHLMHVSEEYLKTMKESQVLQKEIAASAERRAHAEQQAKAEEEITKRERQRQEQQLKQMQFKAREAMELEKIKTQEAKKRIDYQVQKQTEEEEKRERIRIETKKELNRLDEQNRKDKEEQEKRRMEREKELMKFRLEEKTRLQQQTEKDMAEFRLSNELKKHEATKADMLAKEVELKKVEMQAEVDKENIRWNKINDFFTGEQGREHMYNIGGLAAGTIATLYFFKTVTPLAKRGLRNYFFKPTLVSRSVKYTPLSKLGLRSITSLVKKEQPRPEVVMQPRLQQRLNEVIEGTRNTAQRGGLFGHMLLYGRPGTGKTLFAEKLAFDSRMDFAVMSGPSFDQFSSKDAIIEIKNLFRWANNSRRGLLLFVDEADSFLEDRRTLRRDRVTVLNEWLNQTGTESRKFMCVYETNRPHVLDPAIQSRITRSIEITPPTKAELLRMLEQYIHLYVLRELDFSKHPKYHLLHKKGHVSSEELAELELELPQIAEKLEGAGFVGRDVSNLTIALAQAIYAEPKFELTKGLLDRVVEEQIVKKEQENKYLEKTPKQQSAKLAWTA